MDTWAIDLVALHGKVLCYLMVCVDVYTKWVEATKLDDKGYGTVAQWFHRAITCWFGTPAFVHADRRGEFHSEFARYLSRMGCQLVLTLPNNPCTNGLVERINGIIVNGLR